MNTIRYTSGQSIAEKSMRNARHMARQGIGIAVALILVTTFFGCDLFGAKGVTIEERIDMFMKDVNAGNYDKLYTHFHPQDTQQRQQVADPSFWTDIVYFESGKTYTYKIILILNDEAQVTISGSTFFNNTPCTFIMEKSGDDYYIKVMKILGEVVVKSYINK